ncbi:MAG: hypothetical protein IPO95_07380 [Rhodanobacteraceae bacterium]|nr:hypothetical protein [Rhodanobacteraceae bacterium]
MNAKALRALVAAWLLGMSATTQAQLYGAETVSNAMFGWSGPVYMFDPDSLSFLDVGPMQLAGGTGASVTGYTSMTVHPDLAPPNDALNGTIFAVLKVSGVSGRVLAILDLDSRVATAIGNLGDNFASIAFRADGQLFGVTGDGAAVPETLYLIDKTNATKQVARTLGNGADGELIAYNPEDDAFYHWSGNGTVIFEQVSAQAPYDIVNLPISGVPGGEGFGAVWDPCTQRDLGGVPQHAFSVTYLSPSAGLSGSRFWSTTGVVSPAAAVGAYPGGIRGLALVGGYTCDVDLELAAIVPTPAPSSSGPVAFEITLHNRGPARARVPVLAIALPASMSAATTTGCLEDPTGIPVCTPRIVTSRLNLPDFVRAPFILESLFTRASTSIRVDATHDGSGNGSVSVTADSESNETEAENNVIGFSVLSHLFGDSFE